MNKARLMVRGMTKTIFPIIPFMKNMGAEARNVVRIVVSTGRSTSLIRFTAASIRRVAHFPAVVDILRDDDSIIYNDPNQ